MADLDIQNAFLDGIEEVFSIMFTDRLKFYRLDETATEVNVYEETAEKVYLPPIALIGRIQTTFEQGENPIEAIQGDAVVTIPTKQLIKHLIPHTTKAELEKLEKAKFEYDGMEYFVNVVTPKTLVADVWQVYSFECSMGKRKSLGG